MNKKQNRKSRFSFKEAFCVDFNKIKNEMHFCPMLHVNTSGEITVENAGAIVMYNENEVRLDMKGIIVAIKGDSITLRTLEKSLVTVSGRVFNIEFMYGKESK